MSDPVRDTNLTMLATWVVMGLVLGLPPVHLYLEALFGIFGALLVGLLICVGSESFIRIRACDGVQPRSRKGPAVYGAIVAVSIVVMVLPWVPQLTEGSQHSARWAGAYKKLTEGGPGVRTILSMAVTAVFYGIIWGFFIGGAYGIVGDWFAAQLRKRKSRMAPTEANDCD